MGPSRTEEHENTDRLGLRLDADTPAATAAGGQLSLCNGAKTHSCPVHARTFREAAYRGADLTLLNRLMDNTDKYPLNDSALREHARAGLDLLTEWFVMKGLEWNPFVAGRVAAAGNKDLFEILRLLCDSLPLQKKFVRRGPI